MKISKNTYMIILAASLIIAITLSILASMNKINILWVVIAYSIIYFGLKYLKDKNGH